MRERIIAQTWLRLTYALLVALVPWSGLLCLYTWPAVATQDGTAANPWRPPAAPKAAGDGFILIRGGTFFSGDVVTHRGQHELVRIEGFEMLDHTLTNDEEKKRPNVVFLLADELGVMDS
jgi:hypothetical protein